MKYYDAAPMYNSNCDLNLIVSGRGAGKSSRIAIDVVDYCIKNHKQFVLLSRNSLYKMPLYFDGYVNEQILEKHKTTVSFTDKGDSIIRNDTEEVIGFKHFLSLQQIYKSNQFDNVDVIIFEEFCALDAGTYYENEFEMFMSYLSTVFRHRTNGKCYLIGNVMTANNPYFEALGIPHECLMSYGCHVYQSGGTTVCVDVAPPAYESDDEIPPYMRTRGNMLQIKGIYENKSPYVIELTESQINRVKNTSLILVNDDEIYYLNKIKKGKNWYMIVYRDHQLDTKPSPKEVIKNKNIVKQLSELKNLTLFFNNDWTEVCYKRAIARYI